MSFYSYIEQIGESLPTFKKIETKVLSGIEEQLPQTVYQCPVCRSRFIYLTSFTRICCRHLPDLKMLFNELEIDEKFIKIEVELNPEISEKSFETESETSDENENTFLDINDSQVKNKMSRNKKHLYSPPTSKNTILCCPICKKTFMRRQIYRDHMDVHENPLIKCCQICVTEFSSGINANKHKKKFHPELYEQELKERAAERTKDGRRRNRLPPIVIPIIGKNSAEHLEKSEKYPIQDSINYIPYLKRIKIKLEKICLPGFLRNDWIYLPKKDEDYLWTVKETGNIKKETYRNDITSQHKYTTNQELEENDWNEYGTIQEKNENNAIQITDLDGIKHIETVKRNKNSYFIQNEEIPHVPQFQGSKYIFGVYGERRYKKLKETKTAKKGRKPKRRKISSDDDIDLDDYESPNEACEEFLRPSKNYYKNESKMCKICGVTRSNSNIRRHIARHCIEEDDRKCRVGGCEASFTASNKLREHYPRMHKIKFREFLYNMQKGIMDRLKEGNIGKIKLSEDVRTISNTCKICYTNMKTPEDLQYHIEMLHEYKEGGGKSRGTLDCNICGKVFAAVQNRNLHIRRIHKQILDGSVFCHYCGKDFMGKGFLLSHFRYAHFDKNGVFKETSTVVKKRYKHPPKEAKVEDIAQHYQKYKVHSVCEICGLIKESRFAMMRHRYEKHGVIDSGYSKIIDRDREENNCKFCGKQFNSLRKWKDHEKYHLKEIPNLHCQVCGAKCKTETYLKAHMERHGEKKFFCDYEGCGKGFAVKHDVKIHKRRAHCNDLDYLCKICGTAFRTWNYRRYHEETVHGLVKVKQQRNKRRPLPQVATALRQQQQNNDESQESTSQILNQQQTIESGNISYDTLNSYQVTEERDCQYCGKHFDDYKKWQNHEYYHKKINPDLACEICGAKCKTEYYLKAHMERHGEIKYFCEYPECGKGFAVKHDVKIHQRRAHKVLLKDEPIRNESPMFQDTSGTIPIVVLPSQTMLYSYVSNSQLK